jgi:RNA polymerase sigma-70 factor (ECF subfamily)
MKGGEADMSDADGKRAGQPVVPAAFADLIDSCQRPLYAFLRRLLDDDEAARDTMQDTFCAAWQLAQRGAPPFDAAPVAEDALRRWLFHAAYNRAVSHLRRRRLIAWRSLDVDADWDREELVAPGSFEEQVVQTQAVRAALASLTPQEVACLLLLAVHRFTAAEASQIVGASPAAVAKRYARAKQRLRAVYLSQNPPIVGRLPS